MLVCELTKPELAGRLGVLNWQGLGVVVSPTRAPDAEESSIDRRTARTIARRLPDTVTRMVRAAAAWIDRQSVPRHIG